MVQNCREFCDIDTIWGVSRVKREDFNLSEIFVIRTAAVPIILDKQLCTVYRRSHEKTSNVSNYEFITLLHEWVDRGQMHQLEKLLWV